VRFSLFVTPCTPRDLQTCDIMASAFATRMFDRIIINVLQKVLQAICMSKSIAQSAEGHQVMFMLSLCRQQKDKKPFDPFLPYDEHLCVAHLSASHTLLLNKFNLVAHHTLVVTRAFEAQETPLTAADLHATLATLRVRATPALQVFQSAAGTPVPAATRPHAQGVSHSMAVGRMPVGCMYCALVHPLCCSAWAITCIACSCAGVPARCPCLLQPRASLWRQPAPQAPASGAPAAL
jgi:Ap4A phosphorylase N-terminal domain